MTAKTKTIGILGGGQLGRMSALAAATLGLRTHIYCPEEDAPAAQVTPLITQAAYDNQCELKRFAESVDVITYEFENIPLETIEFLENLKPVYPSSKTLAISQNRLIEKDFLNKAGISTAPWAAASCAADIDAFLKAHKTPECILKTTRFGYDGKGQLKHKDTSSSQESFLKLGGDELIIEGIIDFAYEASIIVARDYSGKCEVFPLTRNEHKNHILDKSHFPFDTQQPTGAARPDGFQDGASGMDSKIPDGANKGASGAATHGAPVEITALSGLSQDGASCANSGSSAPISAGAAAGHGGAYSGPHINSSGPILSHAPLEPCAAARHADDAATDDIERRASELAVKLAEELNLIGLIAIEFFVLKDGSLLANEIAPRPHNSGHWTMDGCNVSQFEQHVRAVSGLPLRTPVPHSAVTMVNLIGSDVERVPAYLAMDNACVHLYGKGEARDGRKMGHVNLLGPLEKPLKNQ